MICWPGRVIISWFKNRNACVLQQFGAINTDCYCEKSKPDNQNRPEIFLWGIFDPKVKLMNWMGLYMPMYKNVLFQSLLCRVSPGWVYFGIFLLSLSPLWPLKTPRWEQIISKILFWFFIYHRKISFEANCSHKTKQIQHGHHDAKQYQHKGDGENLTAKFVELYNIAIKVPNFCLYISAISFVVFGILSKLMPCGNTALRPTKAIQNARIIKWIINVKINK